MGRSLLMRSVGGRRIVLAAEFAPLSSPRLGSRLPMISRMVHTTASGDVEAHARFRRGGHVLRHAIGCCLGLLVVGCSGPEASLPSPRTSNEAVAQVRPDPQPKPATKKKKKALSPGDRADAEERKVAVEGIEGTLTSYDVRSTLEKRSKEFGQLLRPRARPCRARRQRAVQHPRAQERPGPRRPHAVLDLGDRVLERCRARSAQGAVSRAPRREADCSIRCARARGEPAN